MRRLINAFFSSAAGFRFGWKHEAALRQEMIVFAVSLPAALLLTTSPWKLIALWGTILLVMIAELLNTGIEKVADRVTREHDELIKNAKDCGSAAVFVALTIAAAVWILAFVERIIL